MTGDERTEYLAATAAPILTDMLPAGEGRDVQRPSEDLLAVEIPMQSESSRSDVADHALVTSGQSGQTGTRAPGSCRLFRGLTLGAYWESGRFPTVR